VHQRVPLDVVVRAEASSPGAGPASCPTHDLPGIVLSRHANAWPQPACGLRVDGGGSTQ